MITKLEELLEISADEWETISITQLEELCKPFYNVTRPDQVAKSTPTKTVTPTAMLKKSSDPDKDAKIKIAIEAARKLGININGLMK
jgi:hypothetical protein